MASLAAGIVRLTPRDLNRVLCREWEISNRKAIHKISARISEIETFAAQRIDLTDYYKEQATYFDRIAAAVHTAGIRTIRPNDTSAIVLPALLANVKHVSWEHEKEHRLIKREGVLFSSYAPVFPAKLYIGTALDGTQYKKGLIESGERLSIPAFQMMFEDVRETYDLVKRHVV